MICSGQCNHKIDVQTVTETRTTDGGFTPGWAHSFYTTGSVLGLTGKEYFEAAQTQGSGTYKITVRNTSNTRGMTIKDRMVATAKGISRTFNLLSITPDARCRDFIIMAVIETA